MAQNRTKSHLDAVFGLSPPPADPRLAKRAVSVFVPQGGATLGTKVYILDEVVVQPGRTAEYRDAYLAGYAPIARSRGMTLESVRVTPPLELDELSNTLHFLWSVPDAAAWWTTRLGGADRRNPEVRSAEEFWERSAQLVVSRQRRTLVDYEVDDVR